MSKRIFASSFLKRQSREVSSNNMIGRDFDEVYLDCVCSGKTLQLYKGYFKEFQTEEIKFNYECLVCGRVNVFDKRL